MKVHEQQPPPFQADHHHPWWRSPWLGYPFAVLFAAAAFVIPLSERSLGIPNMFVEPPFVIATFLVGWFWGIGPALLALLLEILALDYWIVPPLGGIRFFLWPEIASFVPFMLIQLLILVLIVVQKRYQQQLLHASRAAAHHAEELAESNARLQQADRIKDQFLSMASHELRTPVTRIQGSVQLLQRRLKRHSEQHPEWLPLCDALDAVVRQTQQLTDLTNTMLDINALRSGKIPVCLTPCDLGNLCQQVLEEQRSQTDRSIDVHVPADPVEVSVDAGRFSQVVRNLVTNALKYSPANTPICVEINQRPGEGILMVSNERPVLSQEQVQALFEPFYRSPEARSSAIPGWGLGLAICQAIVLQHHGRIWVESSEEKGTTFFVALPLLTDAEGA
ncbi:MAG: HAMP domain-containing histidine kinase [Ktedonobacteraceae bacterium]|nr:HAMP domain-containing histidine kinase [Ktedonobacteraceae bacterium]MBO0794368.1 HAMP domain-containing histidine kinase [Ktedonobacteraceae bacterium]